MMYDEVITWGDALNLLNACFSLSGVDKQMRRAIGGDEDKYLQEAYVILAQVGVRIVERAMDPARQGWVIEDDIVLEKITETLQVLKSSKTLARGVLPIVFQRILLQMDEDSE